VYGGSGEVIGLKLNTKIQKRVKAEPRSKSLRHDRRENRRVPSMLKVWWEVRVAEVQGRYGEMNEK
jgi:hypothetical protein